MCSLFKYNKKCTSSWTENKDNEKPDKNVPQVVTDILLMKIVFVAHTLDITALKTKRDFIGNVVIEKIQC